MEERIYSKQTTQSLQEKLSSKPQTLYPHPLPSPADPPQNKYLRSEVS